MLTPREIAASQFLRTRGMSRRVLGFSPEQNEELRRWRVAQLASAIGVVRAAAATPRILAGEWSDGELQRAAAVLEAQLATETSQLEAPA